jgi:hypothetical protein
MAGNLPALLNLRRVQDALGDSPFKFDESLRIARSFPTPFQWVMLAALMPRTLKEQWREAADYVMYRKAEQS